MANKILITFIALDVIFVLCGGVHLLIPLMTRAALSNTPTLSNVVPTLLLDHCPLTASMVNAVLIFTAFAVSIPAIFFPSRPVFLMTHFYLTILSGLFTLAIGLNIWFSTLQTRAQLAPVWAAQSSFVQSMLQSKFGCCGFDDSSVFVTDDTCPTVAAAARQGPCVAPFATFADRFLDLVFTTFFGFVAFDVLLLLSALCLLKNRKERQRYRLIDEKAGMGPI